MKLLAFQKRATLGSRKYAGPLCCSLNFVVEPEVGLLQPCRTFSSLKPAGNLHMSKQHVVGSYPYETFRAGQSSVGFESSPIKSLQMDIL
jgi:hypothetical protein